MIEFEGEVVDVLPDGMYRVKLENDHEIIAYAAGRMKKFRIRIMTGDRVTIEMTPYDLTKGRINYRHKDANAPMGGPGAQNRPRRGGGGPRRR
jgi:translation initiation factor IF-1